MNLYEITVGWQEYGEEPMLFTHPQKFTHAEFAKHVSDALKTLPSEIHYLSHFRSGGSEGPNYFKLLAHAMTERGFTDATPRPIEKVYIEGCATANEAAQSIDNRLQRKESCADIEEVYYDDIPF